MTTYNEDNCALRTADDGPNITALIAELKETCTHGVGAYDQILRDENTRYAKWAGQSDSGRKPDLVNNKPARPWPGASDVRIRLADEIVVEDVRLMKAAARRAQLVVKGTEGTDVTAAGKVKIYLDHQRNTKLRAELAEQNELAAQWRQTHGYALTAVTWHQEWARDYETVTIEALQQAAAGDPANQVAPNQGVQQLLAELTSPDKDVVRDLAATLVQMYPDLDRGEAYKQLQLLKNTGEMTMPVRYLRLNQPQWEALKVWRDVFFPINTATIQRARWIAWRQTLNTAEVDERKLSEDWSEEFAEAVKKTKGKTVLEQLNQRPGTNRRTEVFTDSREEMSELCEVFYYYYKQADEKGVPCAYKTVLSPHIAQPDPEEPLHGPDGPTGYKHGLYPFIPHRREKPERAIVETRSVPAVTITNQAEIKNLRDARVDQTDLGLRPPAIRPEREVGLPLTIKPMGEIGERRQKSLSFLTVPPVPLTAEPLEAEARRDAERYFARNRAEDPSGAQLADGDLAADWCGELAQGWAMTLQLAQQFESVVEFNRTVGGQPVVFSVSRDEIQGQHDLELSFNPDTLDAELMAAKTERLQNVYVPLDRAGQINLAPVIAGMFTYDFPEFADQALRGVEQSGAAEIKDEQNNWSLMLGAVEPDMAEAGQNFALRLQWLTNKVNEPGAQARLAALPDSNVLVQRRLQHLQFVLSQYTTQAQTGRVGVPPLQPQDLAAPARPGGAAA